MMRVVPKEWEDRNMGIRKSEKKTNERRTETKMEKVE